jgi:hypothetical protein
MTGGVAGLSLSFRVSATLSNRSRYPVCKHAIVAVLHPLAARCLDTCRAVAVLTHAVGTKACGLFRSQARGTPAPQGQLLGAVPHSAIWAHKAAAGRSVARLKILRPFCELPCKVVVCAASDGGIQRLLVVVFA